MEAKEERLVARLRHHNPALTVTELHIGRVGASKKNLVIEYLNSLQLRPSVESSPGLETVVSVDISNSAEQDGIFKKLLAYIRNIGIGEVSITSQPFDERQPEIDSAESIPALDSSSKEYTPLNSEDIEELISRDKSESEFELILSHPRRSESHESRRLEVSSRDVIGSILKVSEEGRSQCSESNVAPHPTMTYSKNPHKSRQGIHAFWKKTKKLFKRKMISHKQPLGSLQAIISNDSMQVEIGKLKKKGHTKNTNLANIDPVTMPNQVSLNALQKRLEKVSRDVFSIKNKCPGMKCEGPSLDAYTQTQAKTPEDVENSSSTSSSIGKHSKQNRRSRTHSLSEISETSASSDFERVASGGEQVAPPTLRGMVPNLIPLYPNTPANLKRPMFCQLKPVGGPFFFRRMNSKQTSSNSTATGSLVTNSTSNTAKSTRTTNTSSSHSVPTFSQGTSDNTSASYENVVYIRSGDEYISYGVISTGEVTSPFERERLKKTQTVNPLLKATEINTSQVFKLPKVTQTRPRKKRTDRPKAPTVGTQTFNCNSSTSCSELVVLRSCGTKTENSEKVDKENSCHLLAKQPTETKETNSETVVLKCETCNDMLDKPAEKKRKSNGKQKTGSAKRGLGWGKYPDGNYGFGQSYAPGKVFPVFSMSTNFHSGGALALPAAVDKGGAPPCSKLCNLFGGKRKALMEELNKQRLELMQMRMVLVAINDELLAECSDSSDDRGASSDDASSGEAPLRQCKKVTFSDPLVNERLTYGYRY